MVSATLRNMQTGISIAVAYGAVLMPQEMLFCTVADVRSDDHVNCCF